MKNKTKKYLTKLLANFIKFKGKTSHKLQLLDQYNGACKMAIELEILTQEDIEKVKTDFWNNSTEHLKETS